MRRCAIVINLSKLTVCYNKYEHVRGRQVYSIYVYSKLYSIQLVVVTYKLQVYNTLYNTTF